MRFFTDAAAVAAVVVAATAKIPHLHPWGLWSDCTNLEP